MSHSFFIDHRIKSIIFVLGSAFASASLLVAFLIYHFGPSGRYVAGDTLLSPQTMEEINQNGQQEKSKKQRNFTFSRIEFSYFDPMQKKIKQQVVSKENYKKFYDLIAQEKSLDQTEQLSLLFADVYPSVLTIAIQSEEKLSHQPPQTFQMVQFKNNYFRVQLHDGESKGEWAYFYYSDLYSKILQLFVSI